MSDAVDRIACEIKATEGAGCHDEKARRITIAVMHEIARCGWDTGRPIGVLDEFAARTGLVFDRAKLLAEEATQ